MNQQITKAEASSLAIAAALCGAASEARADSMEDLTGQVDVLTRKIADMEQRQSISPSAPPAAAAASGVTAGATKGSFKLPGSDTSATFGGYAKLDAVFSNPNAGVGSTADLELEAPNIPVGPNARTGERNQVKLGARQSRLFAGTSTPTPWGALTTYVEGDFYGAAGTESVSNSNGLRVRHAYGTLGGLLAGQTWTTFSDVNTYPEPWISEARSERSSRVRRECAGPSRFPVVSGPSRSRTPKPSRPCPMTRNSARTTTGSPTSQASSGSTRRLETTQSRLWLASFESTRQALPTAVTRSSVPPLA